MISFTIPGAPRTKKNHSVIVKDRKTGTPRVIPSKQFRDWDDAAQLHLAVIRSSSNAGTIQRPVNCMAIFYRDRDVGDAVNYYQALADALEDARIVHDDYLIVSWDGSRLLKDTDNPRIEVTLTEIS